MNEKPIIFAGESVRGILADRKTMTRRVSGKYKVGDLLWVRENIRTMCYPYQDGKFNYGEFLIEYMADNQLVKCPDEYKEWWRHNWDVRSTQTLSSIFMPKWAARIWLEVTAVREERLQKIREEDVLAEGIDEQCFVTARGISTPTVRFARLWDSLNAKRKGCSWSDNPEVRVISFKRIEKKND